MLQTSARGSGCDYRPVLAATISILVAATAAQAEDRQPATDADLEPVDHAAHLAHPGEAREGPRDREDDDDVPGDVGAGVSDSSLSRPRGLYFAIHDGGSSRPSVPIWVGTP